MSKNQIISIALITVLIYETGLNTFDFLARLAEWILMKNEVVNNRYYMLIFGWIAIIVMVEIMLLFQKFVLKSTNYHRNLSIVLLIWLGTYLLYLYVESAFGREITIYFFDKIQDRTGYLTAKSLLKMLAPVLLLVYFGFKISLPLKKKN